MNILVVGIKLPKILIKAGKQVLKFDSCYFFFNFSKGYNFGSKILIWQSTRQRRELQETKQTNKSFIVTSDNKVQCKFTANILK